MGASNSCTKDKIAKINKNNWKQISDPQYIVSASNQNQFKTYLNTITKQIVHRYKINILKKSHLNQYYQSFLWRKKKKNIVQISHIIQDDVQNQQNWCSDNKTISVCIQQVIIRLSAIKDIPFPENLYFLISILNGFQSLYNIFGYFQIQQQMICVDNQGKVKVWINSNLSKNQPIQQKKIFKQHFSINQSQIVAQTTMVNNIVNIITRNTDATSQPYPFVSYLANMNNFKLTFDNCRRAVLGYAEQIHIQIPKLFGSIFQILNQGSKSQKIHQQIGINKNSSRQVSDSGHILYGKNYKNNYLLNQNQIQNKRLHISNLQLSEGDSSQNLNQSLIQIKHEVSQMSQVAIKPEKNIFDGPIKIQNRQGYKNQIRMPSAQINYQLEEQNSSPKYLTNSSFQKKNKLQNKFSFSNNKEVKEQQNSNSKITFQNALNSSHEHERPLIKDNMLKNQYNYKITQSNMICNSQNKNLRITDSNFVNNKSYLKNTQVNHQRNSIINEEQQLQSNQNSKAITPRQTKYYIINSNNSLNRGQAHGWRNDSKRQLKIKITTSNEYDESALLSPKKQNTKSKLDQVKITFKDAKQQYQLDLQIAEDLKKQFATFCL